MTTATKWSGPGWVITAEGNRLRIGFDGHAETFSSNDAGGIMVRRSFFGLGRAYLTNPDTSLRLCLHGIRRRESRALRHRVEAMELFGLLEWGDRFDTLIRVGIRDQLWITRERRDEVKHARPQAEVSGANRRAFPMEAARADEILELDVDAVIANTNEKIIIREFATRERFFDTIEQQPLTDEQKRAVVEYDNRVQIVAAAGSGKTSVMVARAAYAIDKGITTPDRVLLLAFNRAAAKELQDRVEARFEAAGIPFEGVRASTFHSLGLRAIGMATGAKPRVAPWVANDGDTKKISQIAYLLRDERPDYWYKWDLYRLIFARAPITGPEKGTPDGYDTDRKVRGYKTLDHKVVKSYGEKMVADWLFINGVNYEYERRYVVSTATSEFGQYHPDFYYPDIGTWHEHWAIGSDGKPPAEWDGYADGMAWKRDLHRCHGTDLIETTWHEIVNEHQFDRLAKELESREIKLDWDPSRIAETSSVMTDRDLERLFRTFMTHIKSNSLSKEDLKDRLSSEPLKRLDSTRTRLFLDLYWPIHEAWDADLEAGNYVDFEDMLVKAAEHLERGEVDLGYDLILVDEFQDASRARVRLAMGLVSKPHRHLLAVGDDWQSINRFAGADISAMTDFETWFGPASQLKMTRTFRFPQELADISSNFVMKNPRQIPKTVNAANVGEQNGEKPIKVVYQEPSQDVLAALLDRISNKHMQKGEAPSVFILGRYRFNRDLAPSRRPSSLNVEFSTVHGSKGREADYVIVPNMGVGVYGFPTGIEDDPVLNLAMSQPDAYPHAEERRLFYVALTRARRGVVLVTSPEAPSPFVVELARSVDGIDHNGVIHQCQACGQGTMVKRQGSRGSFFGCSRFPVCAATAPTADATPTIKNLNDASKSGRRCTCGGMLILRKGKYGPFYGCSNYPDCDYTRDAEES